MVNTFGVVLIGNEAKARTRERERTNNAFKKYPWIVTRNSRI